MYQQRMFVQTFLLIKRTISSFFSGKRSLGLRGHVALALDNLQKENEKVKRMNIKKNKVLQKLACS